MQTIEVVGWNVGFQKVEFTLLLRKQLSYSLTEAKRCTDAVLDHHVIQVNVPESDLLSMLRSMQALGAQCRLPSVELEGELVARVLP